MACVGDQMFGGTPGRLAVLRGDNCLIAHYDVLFQLWRDVRRRRRTFRCGPARASRYRQHFVLSRRRSCSFAQREQIPAHTQWLRRRAQPGEPGGNVPATSFNVTSSTATIGPMSPAVVSTGGTRAQQPQPFLCIDFIISYTGVFPTWGLMAILSSPRLHLQLRASAGLLQRPAPAISQNTALFSLLRTTTRARQSPSRCPPCGAPMHPGQHPNSPATWARPEAETVTLLTTDSPTHFLRANTIDLQRAKPGRLL